MQSASGIPIKRTRLEAWPRCNPKVFSANVDKARNATRPFCQLSGGISSPSAYTNGIADQLLKCRQCCVLGMANGIREQEPFLFIITLDVTLRKKHQTIRTEDLSNLDDQVLVILDA